jgi:hypothetical protein
MAENHIFIGIDDTDTQNSNGTGFLSRELAKQIESNNLGKVVNITRHQLFISNKIKYTNRNNSACIELLTSKKDLLILFCREMVLSSTNPESQPVIVYAESNLISENIIDFSCKAKTSIQNINDAIKLAKDSSFVIDFLRSGKKNGVIGAVAAIGLRATGNDGRVIWVNGYEIKGLTGTYMVGEVYCRTHVDAIRTIDGYKVPTNASIDFENKRIKPVLKDNTITFLVEEINNGQNESIICTNFKASLN